MKRIAQFLRASTARLAQAPEPEPKVSAMDFDEEDSVIDLTSDTEACAEDGEDSVLKGKDKKGKGKKKAASVKKESMKRAAKASKEAAQSGDVQVTSKPAESMDEITRPSKRGKSGEEAAAASSGAQDKEEEEEDVEMVGTKGGSALPHNRFDCPENLFVAADKAGHKERCKLCFCYVCDRPAGECLEWSDHCHATTSGPTASMWTRLRARAKPLAAVGKRPPVSGLDQGSPRVGPVPSASFLAHGSPPSGWLPSALAGSGASAPPPPPLALPVQPCDCERLCQQVQKVIGSDSPYGSTAPTKRVVYFAGLTEAQAQHVEDIAVEAGANFIADIKVYRNYRMASTVVREARKNAYLQESRPYFHKTLVNGKFDVAVARKREAYHGVTPSPWEPKWTPGAALPLAVRLGVLSGVGFTISTPNPQYPAKRKAFFERFVSPKPIPASVWAEETRNMGPGCLKLVRPEDDKLFEDLAYAHRDALIDVELQAEYDASKNSGSLTVEVILLSNLLNRTTLAERRASTKSSKTIDWVRIVERLVPKTTHEQAKGKAEVASAHSTAAAAAAAAAATTAAATTTATAVPSPVSAKKTASTKTTAAKTRSRGKGKENSAVVSTTSTAAAAAAAAAAPSSSSTKKKASKKAAAATPRSAGRRAATDTAAAAAFVSAPASGGGASGGGCSATSGEPTGGAGASADLGVGVAAAAGAVVGGPGRVFTSSAKGYGGRASTDVTLQGLIDSVRAEENNSMISSAMIYNPAQLLKELENVQHGALVKQPDCLTVQLFEHQLQAAQWMYDQEVLDGGTMQHLWAELPPHPQAPAIDDRSCEFRRCWFSPILNRFTATNPLSAGIKGGVLCAEMGLGKTAATLALHLINPPKTPSEGVPFDEKEWGPITGAQAAPMTAPRSLSGATRPPATHVSKGTLVVVKVSLVGQWKEEATRLSGGKLKIYEYHGTNRKKDPAFLAKFDIVVTTYGVVQVLDESHTIAAGGNAATSVKALVANRRWCMTGTPCNVKFSDFNGQLAFIGAAGALRTRDIGDKRPNKEALPEVVAFFRRVVLRHSQGMKLGANSLLGLPSITTKVEELTLPKEELEAYRKFEKALQKEYLAVRHRLLNCSGSHTMAVLTLLSKFRQACSGGQLLLYQPTPETSDDHGGDLDDDEAEEEAEDEDDGATADSMDAFCSVCHEPFDSPVKTHCGHAFCQACIAAALTEGDDDEGSCPKCKKPVKLADLAPIGGVDGELGPVGGQGVGVMMETKLQALVAKLADIKSKDPTSKSLVFSQYNSSLDWLKHALPKRGFEFRTLTGGMSRKQRTDSLQAFAADPPTTIFLLSVRAGAVGINLTQANNVFLLEPMLNLALEKQAIGRVHRLGQTRPVTVTKLVLADSVETRILAMQKKQADGEGSAGFGSSAATQSGIAGSLARDVAKDLKVEEYNQLFGVDDGVQGKWSANTKAKKSGW